MDNVLKAIKWALVNWKLILPILAFLGITGATGYHLYAPQKPIQVTKSLPIPAEPVNAIAPPPPPTVVREVIKSESCTKICGELIHKHERKFHFTD